MQNTGDSFFSPGTTDNSAGTITLVFDTLVGSTVGAAGPGTLASVQFKALTAGTASIDFSPLDDLVLEDSNGNTLAATPIPGSVHVVPTPEPATYSLAAALVLIFFKRLAASQKTRVPRVLSSCDRFSSRACF